mgnify:CR=1 FL=1
MAKPVKNIEHTEPEAIPGEVQDTASTVEAAEAYSGAVIYVGPSIKGSVLHTFAIFADGVPEEYRKDVMLKHLFVKPEDLELARQEIGRSGSMRNSYYKRVMEAEQERG